MIRLGDAIILAHTKLRTHKIRTGLTVGVAGILFGILFGGVFVAQGIFDSVERFNQEGLADRSIIAVSKFDNNYFDVYGEASNSEFIAEVRKAHADKVALKVAAAKKYGIPYDPKSEDPSPIELDSNTQQERISDTSFDSEVVQSVVAKRTNALYQPLDIDTFIKPYTSARVLEGNSRVQPSDGLILPIEDGKEKVLKDRGEQFSYQMGGSEDTPIIQKVNNTITAPFVVESRGEVPEGELPGVVSFKYAEKLLGLEALGANATNEQKLERLQEVRSRIDEITASFCYRNSASQYLVLQASTQKQEIERNKNNSDYVMPSLIYALPAEDSCGAVAIAKDTRTEIEKGAAANIEAYQKEIGTYIGDPVQHKMTLRAVGLSGDALDGMSSGAGDLVKSLLGSWLGYGATWSIPANLLAEAPEALRPASLFGTASATNAGIATDMFRTDMYIVEFSDKDEARTALDKSDMANGLSVSPYGSGTLIIDEFKRWFLVALLWALAVVGGVALIILAGLIGRMVSDGRRESAVFRAIGARRTDIGSIYGMYALLLSLRVAVFSLVVGLVLALGVELWLSADATTSARLAYAATDVAKEFHFIGIGSWYIPAMLGGIIATGLLASIIPILLGARRNPISDMRDDT